MTDNELDAFVAGKLAEMPPLAIDFASWDPGLALLAAFIAFVSAGVAVAKAFLRRALPSAAQTSVSGEGASGARSPGDVHALKSGSPRHPGATSYPGQVGG